MAQSESNRVSVRFSEETTWNETPSSPTMAELPYTSESMSYEKRTVKSNTVRADRLTDDVIEVGGGSSGDISFEYKFGDFDKLIEGALGSAFTSLAFTGSANVDFAASSGGTQVLTVPSGSMNTVPVGAYVKIGGAGVATANKGVFLVTARGTTSLTVKNAAGTAESGKSATVTMKHARTGTTKKSYLIEKGFLDIDEYISFRGCRVGSWNMNIETEAIVTGSFGFVGAGAFTATNSIAGSVTSQGSLTVANATSNIGRIEENGTALTTALRSVKFSLNANPRALPAVGTKFPIGVNLGSFEITGTIDAYFEDLTLYNKFLNHDNTSLVLEMISPESDNTLITLHSLRFTKASPVGAGLNQDVMVSLDFTSKKDSTYTTMMQVDLLT